MDEKLANSLNGLALSNATALAQTGSVMGQSLIQGLGTIQNLVIQAQASVSDDPGLIAALQTGSRAPAGSN